MKAEKLHGMFIANIVMTRSLLTVLPSSTLPILQEELEQTMEEGKAHVLAMKMSDEAVAAFHGQADMYREMVQLEVMRRQEIEPYLEDDENGPA